jgi:hypothetical protein
MTSTEFVRNTCGRRLAICMRLVAGPLIALQLSGAASAADLAAAARTFAADLAHLPTPSPVVGGWRGNDSYVEEFSVERIMDLAGWRALWMRHAPAEAVPSVDFAEDMVIAIFVGTVPISVIPDVKLVNAVESDRIELTTMHFFNDVITQASANHYLLIVLHRSKKPIRVIARSNGLMRTPRESEDVWKEFDAIDENK